MDLHLKCTSLVIRQPPPRSLYKLLGAVKNLIALGVTLNKEIVHTLIDECLTTEDHNMKIVFSAVALLCKRVGIDPEALLAHFNAVGFEPSARLLRQVENIQTTRQARLELEQRLNTPVCKK
jgi:hypothetical protein